MNEMTEFSGGYGDEWDGNSILLRIDNEHEFRYVHIGMVITEFTTNEQITKFVSNVGNRVVPYPYAESLNWCYCMIDFSKTPITAHEERERLGHISYIKGAKYESLNETLVKYPCDIDNIKSPISPLEKTGCVRFNQPLYQ
jgi:hypothetical protein